MYKADNKGEFLLYNTLIINQDRIDLSVNSLPTFMDPYLKITYIRVEEQTNFNNYWILQNRHWLLNMGVAPLPNETVARVDSYYAQRWETLLSVDDMAASTIRKLADIGQLDNTYILYTSDHGYHLGNYTGSCCQLLT